MKKKITEKILHDTEVGYDSIAQKFSQTRKHFWRGLEFLKDYVREGDTVFDFGCGNGRLLELIGDVKNLEYYGADVSAKLIDIAKNKYVGENIKFSKLNPVQNAIPFESGFFNTICSIAVFHHFPSKEYREKMAKELYRVTKPSGHVVITVWYLWQKKYFKNILKNWIKKIKGGSELEVNDCMISFTDNQGKVFQRFHHAFTRRELKKLFESAGFEIEKCEVVGERNIILIGKKL